MKHRTKTATAWVQVCIFFSARMTNMPSIHQWQSNHGSSNLDLIRFLYSNRCLRTCEIDVCSIWCSLCAVLLGETFVYVISFMMFPSTLTRWVCGHMAAGSQWHGWSCAVDRFCFYHWCTLQVNCHCSNLSNGQGKGSSRNILVVIVHANH